MRSIRCRECGLLNWDTQESCKRCGTALSAATEVSDWKNQEVESENDVASFSPAVQADVPMAKREAHRPAGTAESRGSHRKAVFILAAIGLLLLTASIPLAYWIFKTSTPDYAKLIPTSPAYRKTLNILINRENRTRVSTEEQMSGLNIPHKTTMLPETLMLYHAGLLKFHQLSDPPGQGTDVAFLMNEFTIEPKTDEIARQWRVVDRRMKIGNSTVNESSQWWIVPIGEREFAQVAEAQKYYDSGTATDYLNVDFKWRWRPNEAGRALDISQPSYKSPEDIVGRGNWSASDSMGMPLRDSRAMYDGHAKLRKQNDGNWSVDTVWFADSPDQHYPGNEMNQDYQRHTWNIEGF